ncbi:MAG TPA: sigma-70 family RNA polymerase sigma factor [Gemmatimonadaceae bacterium]|nr:sigma-70 family RNA polymerase sigma factor [Gemmatimonadaceae bacterium]
MPASSPADLVARARTGDPDALTALYATFGDSLMALAFRLTASRADAEDVLHDVFLGLPEALRRYEERGSLESWLKRITARVALSRLRARTRQGEIDLPDDLPLGEPSAPDRLADFVAVREAIETLPHSLRTVVVLRELEGYSHSEIAELLGISTNASEVRLHRAIRALRSLLGVKP